MSGRFNVTPVNELLAQTGVTFAEVKEHRAAGFREGFTLAVHVVDALTRAGYSRPSEIGNVLWEHLEAVVRWKAFDEWPFPEIVPWAELREQVFERDGRYCAMCSSVDDPQIDHIVAVKDGGLPLLPNLRVLCRRCNCARNRKCST